MSAQPFPVHTIPGATSPQVHQQQMVQTIAHQVQQATGEQHQVAVVNEETPLQQFSQFYDRAILGKPGVEPSKNFLSKLKDRMQKKHPDAEIRMK